jgi:integrase
MKTMEIADTVIGVLLLGGAFILYRFAKILHNADLPSFHYHSLRHLFATRCVELGFDVKTLSEILGHSSVEVTLNRYIHSDLERKRI